MDDIVGRYGGGLKGIVNQEVMIWLKGKRSQDEEYDRHG